MRFGLLVSAVIIAGGFIFWKDISDVVDEAQKSVAWEKKRESKDDKKHTSNVTPDVQVTKKWNLPAELKEVSGIAFLGDNRFACVQDEEGIIFIYNTSSEKIERKISFGAAGDYEGIAVNGNTAYVVRADGRLYEVNIDSDKTSAKEYKTPLTVEHNVEGLFYDKNNNRLLLAAKDGEPGDKNYKGIYAFDLSNKKLAEEPVLKIDLKNDLLNKQDGKKNKPIAPSAIGIHPETDEVYITDGPKSRLLIMDRSGTIKELLELGKDFAQPEGITFSPQGDVFISNEGTKQPGNILQVKVK